MMEPAVKAEMIELEEEEDSFLLQDEAVSSAQKPRRQEEQSGSSSSSNSGGKSSSAQGILYPSSTSRIRFDPLSQQDNGEKDAEPPCLSDIFRVTEGFRPESFPAAKSSSFLCPQKQEDQSNNLFANFANLSQQSFLVSNGGPSNETLVQCTKCSFATCKPDNMARHMETCPNIHPKFRGPEGRLQCDLCDYTTRRTFNLRRHIVSRNCAGRRAMVHNRNAQDILPVESSFDTHYTFSNPNLPDNTSSHNNTESEGSNTPQEFGQDIVISAEKAVNSVASLTAPNSDNDSPSISLDPSNVRMDVSPVREAIMSVPNSFTTSSTIATTSSGFAGGKLWSHKPPISLRRWKTLPTNKQRRIQHDQLRTTHELRHREIMPKPNNLARKFAMQDVVWQKAKEVFGSDNDTLQGLLETVACRLNERSFVQLDFESCRSVKMMKKWIAEDYDDDERNL